MTATIPFPQPTQRPARVGGSPDRPDLSDREAEVLRAWLVCDTKREVTERLFIADSTVSTYIQRVRQKYAAVGRPARTKTRLLLRALEDGYIGLADL